MVLSTSYMTADKKKKIQLINTDETLDSLVRKLSKLKILVIRQNSFSPISVLV